MSPADEAVPLDRLFNRRAFAVDEDDDEGDETEWEDEGMLQQGTVVETDEPMAGLSAEDIMAAVSHHEKKRRGRPPKAPNVCPTEPMVPVQHEPTFHVLDEELERLSKEIESLVEQKNYVAYLKEKVRERMNHVG